MLAERAARTAARNRGLALGSGKPERAAVVRSRIILVKTLARFLSCAPFRYMIFLNCEWPAFSAAPLQPGPTKPIWQDWGGSGASAACFGSKTGSRTGHIFGEPAADSHRLDTVGQTRHIIDHDKDAAQARLALGGLRLLAWHLG